MKQHIEIPDGYEIERKTTLLGSGEVPQIIELQLKPKTKELWELADDIASKYKVPLSIKKDMCIDFDTEFKQWFIERFEESECLKPYMQHIKKIIE